MKRINGDRKRPNFYFRPFLFLFLLMAMECLGGVTSYCDALMRVWTETSMVKVKRDAKIKQLSTISLQAARNEFEIGQIIVYAENTNLINVDLKVSNLISNTGEVISAKNVLLYRQEYLFVKNRSNVEGEPGHWPDPLIPKVDIFYKERRSAFPFTVKQGDNQPVLLEIYIPTTTNPGTYTGKITVSAADQQSVLVPIKIKVWNFTLPSTSTLKTSYAVSIISVTKGFFRGIGYNNTKIFALLMKYFLLHRISPRVCSWQSHAPYIGSGKNMKVDWKTWDAYWGPFLDGTALNNIDLLPGAKFSTWDLLTQPLQSSSPVDIVPYADKQVEHFKSKGWTQYLYVKTFDEPEKNQFSAVHTENQKWLGKMNHPVPLLVTTGFNKEFEGEVTNWCEVVNYLHRYDDHSKKGKRDSYYVNRLALGEKLWWYQSCESTGCFVDGKPPFNINWPSMAVDHQGIYQRIMPWLTWVYDISGELYYNVAENWDQWDGKDGSKNDPWLNFDHFRLNGDGRLFYPGFVDRVGGKHPIPIESLRLKYIRKGYEDYEYFVLAKKLGLTGELNKLLSTIIMRNNNWDKDPLKMMDVRDKIGELISQKATYLEKSADRSSTK